MSYNATDWNSSNLTAENLNKSETQYEKAVADGNSSRQDNTRRFNIERVSSLPSAGMAGRVVMLGNELRVDTGSRWHNNKLNVIKKGEYTDEINVSGGSTVSLYVYITMLQAGEVRAVAHVLSHYYNDITLQLYIDGYWVDTLTSGNEAILEGNRQVSAKTVSVELRFTNNNSFGSLNERGISLIGVGGWF